MTFFTRLGVSYVKLTCALLFLAAFKGMSERPESDGELGAIGLDFESHLQSNFNLKSCVEPGMEIKPVSGLCNVPLPASTCFHVKTSELLSNCSIIGPKDGFAMVYSLDTVATATIGEHVTVNISGNVHFKQVRFNGRRAFGGKGTTRVLTSFGSTVRFSDCDTNGTTVGVAKSATRNGGAICASELVLGRGSRLEITNVSAQSAGGAISVGDLTLEEAANFIVVNSMAASRAGALHINNKLTMGFRSALKITNCTATHGWGGGIMAPRLHMVRESKVEINDSLAHHGGAIYVTKMLYAEHDATIKIRNSASVDTGGAIFAEDCIALQSNARIEISNSSNGQVGDVLQIHQVMEGGAIYCECLTMSNSSIVVVNSASGFDAGAIYAENVSLANASNITVVNAAAKHEGDAIITKDMVLTDSSTIRLHSIAPHARGPFGEAILVLRSIWVDPSSSLEISDSRAGIRVRTDATVSLHGLRIQNVTNFGVHALEVASLMLFESSFVAVGDTAIYCLGCRAINVTASNFSNVSSFLVSNGRIEQLTLDSTNVGCTSTERSCVQVHAPDLPNYKPRVELKSLHISLSTLKVQQQQLLFLRLPAATELFPESVQTSCPAGSFHKFQEHHEYAVLARMCVTPEFAEFVPSATQLMPVCGEETKMLNCSHSTTDGNIRLCEASLDKRESSAHCISCPFGRYSMHPNLHEIHFPLSDLNSSETWCADCGSAYESVGAQIACSSSEVQLPRGVMATTDASDLGPRLSFWHCPNIGACDGTSLSSSVVTGSQASQGMCKSGYNASVPGCVACEWSEYGRSTTDPFVCERCGRWSASMASFLLGPLGILLLGLHSAKQRTRKRMSMILKVLLSFGTVVQTIHNIVRQTKVYKDTATGQHQRWLNGFASQSDGSAVMVSYSMDCLFGGGTLLPARENLLLQLMVALVPLALFLVLEICSGPQYFQVAWIQRTTVLGNTFLPKLLGHFLRWLPCFQMQSGGTYYPTYLYGVSYDSCNMQLGLQIAGAGVLLFFATGPVYWLILLRRSSSWEEETYKDCLGYLVAGYRKECQWWEVVVVLRKALLVCAVILFPSSYTPSSLTTCAVTVTLAATVLHVRLQPYDDALMNAVETATLTCSIVALVLANYLVTAGWSQSEQLQVTVLFTLYGGILLMFLTLSLLLFLSFAGTLKDRLRDLKIL
eukprot:TRINITY_DN20042_c0_g1_i2.p1 TRINITY_DN20042_c0_g1~~TRINITY_DN20042_c0_g1_i2.p1  ORF type:complete len:1185 (-),score=107.03 TRINITY_DN20042_c0_g1_i2:206-3760(-)